jgi:hypothetical protein
MKCDNISRSRTIRPSGAGRELKAWPRRAISRSYIRVLTVLLLNSALPSCLVDSQGESKIEVGETSQKLEPACASITANATAAWAPDFPEIDSNEPYTPGRPDSYGSLLCSGFIGEITNEQRRQSPRLAIQGAGWLWDDEGDTAERDLFGSPETCNAMYLQGDFWGIGDGGIRVPLASLSTAGVWDPNYLGNGAFCHLMVTLERPPVFSAYRFVGRVTSGTSTYPMRMIVD